MPLSSRPTAGGWTWSAKLDTGKVEIALTDTGVGIAPEDPASLVEEFKQLARTAAGRRKARG